MQRRALMAAFAALALAAPGARAAERFPDKPITAIIPFEPGGPTDAMVRAVAPSMTQRLGQAIVVVNRSGAGGNIGATVVARADKDGYTLLAGGSPTVISPHFMKGLAFDPLRDLTGVAALCSGPYYIVVNSELPVRTVPELIAMAKKNPRTVTYASSGVGNRPHVAGAQFAVLTGTQMVHVPYKGTAPATNDLLGNRVTFMFTGLTTVRAHIQSGRLRALAVCTPARDPDFPDVPTLAEGGGPRLLPRRLVRAAGPRWHGRGGQAHGRRRRAGGAAQPGGGPGLRQPGNPAHLLDRARVPALLRERDQAVDRVLRCPPEHPDGAIMTLATLRTADTAKRTGTVQSRVSPEEWDARVNLAACYRLMAHFGLTEMIANHISCRVPGAHDRFLINAYGLFYEEITASSLIEIDLDGTILHNPTDLDVNKAGFVIHGAIHRALPEVDCVIHTHTVAGMAVSALECGLLPMSQTAMRFAKVAYHAFEGVAINLDEQARLVADLGDHEAMVLRNHGLLTVGGTIMEAFNTMFRFERACQVQIAAMSCGQKLSLPPDDVVQATYEIFHPKLQPAHRRKPGRLEWPGLLRMLDRIDTSYRN